MKSMKLTIVTALALSALGFVSTSASAAPVTTGSDDLILGFEVVGGAGTGGTTDLEIDLGAASLFTSSYSVNSFSSVLGADLVSTYGANWATNTNLVWGVGGVLGSTVNSGIDLTSQTAVKTAASSALQSGYGPVSSLAAGLNGQTALTSSAAGQVANSQANSWVGERTIQGSVTTDDFNMPNFTGGSSETTGGPIGSISLYTFTPNSSRTPPLATLDGTFSLSGSGSNVTFSFNPQAVPEPSAYALGLCAMLLFWVLKRRSSIV